VRPEQDRSCGWIGNNQRRRQQAQQADKRTSLASSEEYTARSTHAARSSRGAHEAASVASRRARAAAAVLEYRQLFVGHGFRSVGSFDRSCPSPLVTHSERNTIDIHGVHDGLLLELPPPLHLPTAHHLFQVHEPEIRCAVLIFTVLMCQISGLVPNYCVGLLVLALRFERLRLARNDGEARMKAQNDRSAGKKSMQRGLNSRGVIKRSRERAAGRRGRRRGRPRRACGLGIALGGTLA